MVWLEAFRRYFEHSTNGFFKMLTELLNVFWNYRIVVLFRKHIPVQKYERCQKTVCDVFLFRKLNCWNARSVSGLV